MKRSQALFLHPLLIFTRLLLVSTNVHALADASSLQQQFRVDTNIELAQFFDRNIIKFEFVKQNWELEFDAANYQFKTISDQLQLATSISESDPVDSFALTLVENQSQCYDSTGAETATKDFSTVWVDGKQMLMGDTFINEDLDELDMQGKTRSLDVDLSFDPLNYGDDNCSGSIQMSVELEI
ncbi:hypothetical protein [Psychromonas sp. Urea-02u-13]|uniref:hypothetical protein n=1 Tax=Psychromonas sp. Urea-02u-13 TaxID=2058326 RepID=UPI000C33603D|nr:hypothetical protein [Psychromonas sp. Urea-02u-13]PKG40498.1 hypothetical protein CXF74_02605 [Psychromonas sp. Urea-02u-13]